MDLFLQLFLIFKMKEFEETNGFKERTATNWGFAKAKLEDINYRLNKLEQKMDLIDEKIDDFTRVYWKEKAKLVSLGTVIGSLVVIVLKFAFNI